MKKQYPIYLLIGAIGVAIGLLLQKPQASTDQSETSASQVGNISLNNESHLKQLSLISGEIDSLRTQMVIANNERQKLQGQLQTLAAKLEQITVGADEETGLTDNQQRTFSTDPRRPSDKPKQWFNFDALIGAGVNDDEANRLRSVYEDVEMQKLYLRDRAIREQWINSTRYHAERAKLNNQLTALQDELDENTYDAFLYASGRPNRVVVQSMLSNSPARDAGMLAGDHIIKYGGKRVYSNNDLRKATTQGQADNLAEVIIERNGKPMTLYVPRGPLGVRLDNTRVTP